MRALLSLLLVVLLFSACDFFEKEPEKTCTYTATVVDMSGLDGCGYVFRLDNGQNLEPVWQWGWCGTPPFPDEAMEDPLWDFKFVDGQRVRIGYEFAEQNPGICMVGEQVYITCLEVIGETAVE